MKRLFFSLAMVWMAGCISSCSNDNVSPDTSGATPGGIDTVHTPTYDSSAPNINNDRSNISPTENTGDPDRSSHRGNPPQ